uniref:NADH dehydrogenase subunit 4L n=1 Tax=Habropoda radoszkowskii TaxID=597470 RepID=A0A7L8EYZ5_9HYME|nr:NADH dehydrogenase subunit 4L [Habropoda radoszkowskii]QOE17523.1 NADH dehydrogenase subunit 4L [Habropoda radoszkowskii]
MYMTITAFIILIMIIIAKSESMLNYLIFIEYMVLVIILMIIINQSSNDWVFMIYLIYTVSEAIIGLTLLVKMNQSYGHQNINLINLCSN